jgi:hypothetical protein
VRMTEAAQGRQAVSMRVRPVLTSVDASFAALASPNLAQTAAWAAAVALALAAAVALAAAAEPMQPFARRRSWHWLAVQLQAAAAVVLLQRKAPAEVLALMALMALPLLELSRSFS